uniref:Orn/DAP/Arg decarboxylase 2 N-terminal domain-containing protein n=1 Tax=Bosea sp. NBC_00436 TaxID=2969620 RepID=A0A9E8CQX5_9HYPH
MTAFPASPPDAACSANPETGAATGAALLAAIAIPTDSFSVGADGVLAIAGHDVRDLLERFGSPLYVTVEDTIRCNYRALHDAFANRWAGGIDVFYALKTNSLLAIRAILHQEGAGGECLGPIELKATLAGGADPERIVVNGSDKQEADLLEAARLGAVINIDGEDEIGWLDRPGLSERPVRVNLRLKLLAEAFDDFDPQFFKTGSSVRESLRRAKWGYGLEAATALVRRILASPHLELIGYSSHVGRFSNLPQAYAVGASELVKTALAIEAETGFWPRVVNLGGGWSRQREPESRKPDMNPHSIDDYATVVTAALAEAMGERPKPRLWLEPGRYLVGNAVTLLTRVGAIKRDVGHSWVHVDTSSNQLMRTETSQARHMILPATRMHAPLTEKADVVGPTCIPSLLGAGRPLPVLERGDILAILDAGMYAEALANQFNGMPRPANVLLSASGAAVIRQRESFEDMYALQRIPAHLKQPREAGHE